MSILQGEFERLIGLSKVFEDSSALSLCEKWSRDIVSVSSKDAFVLHYNLSSFNIEKFSYHKTYRKTIPLLRFDLNRHTNPDGVVFEGAHIHIYQEGFDDKIAFPVSEIGISTEDELKREEVLERFLDYCNVGAITIEPIMNI